MPALTGVRFIAALGVVLLHYCALVDAPAWLWAILTHGRAGVSFFFVLSGFILTYNYRDWFTEPPRWAAYRAFGRARFARVYPMYLVALLIASPAALVAMYHDIEWFASVSPTQALVSWICNLTTLQVYIPLRSFVQLWNGPAWSICCEFFFYAVLPFFLAFAARRLRTLNGILVAILVLYAAEFLLWVSASLLFIRLDNRDLIFYFAYISPFFRVWEFLIGACLALVYLDHPPRWLQQRRNRDLLLAASLLMVVVVIIGTEYHLVGNLSYYVAFTPWFALIILGLASGPTMLTGWLSSGPMVLLGEASYSLYLIHSTPAFIVRLVYGKEAAPGWLVALVAIFCVVASVATLKLIEVPARRMLRGPGREPKGSGQ